MFKTFNIAYFQIEIQLFGVSAYPDGSLSQLIRKSAVIMHFYFPCMHTFMVWIEANLILRFAAYF
jgi:hypothetical protein